MDQDLAAGVPAEALAGAGHLLGGLLLAVRTADLADGQGAVVHDAAGLALPRLGVILDGAEQDADVHPWWRAGEDGPGGREGNGLTMSLPE